MPERYIFHLAFPVRELESSKHFYVGILGAEIGRENSEWMDILIWGHQLTLYYRPDDVLPTENQGKRHFGVVLPWKEWENLAKRIKEKGGDFIRAPETLLAGTPEEQGKFYLEDPSNNVIEIKTYKDFSATLRHEGDMYRYNQA